VEKVGDMQEILKYKVIRTPGLVINDQVVLTGSVPKLTELKSLLHHISQKE
jgi:hypothetical protein